MSLCKFDLIILKWAELEQMLYYKVDRIEFVPSKFHTQTVPIAHINNVWYWMPESTLRFTKNLKNWNVDYPIIIFAGGKQKYGESDHDSWTVLFYFSYLSLMKKLYDNFESSFLDFKQNLDWITHEE